MPKTQITTPPWISCEKSVLSCQRQRHRSYSPKHGRWLDMANSKLAAVSPTASIAAFLKSN